MPFNKGPKKALKKYDELQNGITPGSPGISDTTHSDLVG